MPCSNVFFLLIPAAMNPETNTIAFSQFIMSLLYISCKIFSVMFSNPSSIMSDFFFFFVKLEFDKYKTLSKSFCLIVFSSLRQAPCYIAQAGPNTNLPPSAGLL